jgi:hypothetical protein
MMDDGDDDEEEEKEEKCGAVRGMSGRGNQNNRQKPAPVPICPRRIPLFDPGSNPGHSG